MKNTSFIDTDINVGVNPNIKVHPNPAPQKMAMATTILENYVLSQKKKYPKTKKQTPLSPLQTELLSVYTFNPTEQQMLQLKDFLAQLFGAEIYKSKATQEEEMTA